MGFFVERMEGVTYGKSTNLSHSAKELLMKVDRKQERGHKFTHSSLLHLIAFQLGFPSLRQP
jgi:hypothetical protein